jgi:L-seryl-tRNA(Ser) seleniumtransferase
MTADTNALLRSLPSVSALLEHEEVQEWLGGLPRAAVVAAVRDVLDQARSEILDGQQHEPYDLADLLARAEEALVEGSVPSLRRVINATGVVLHTGLGRAPLCDAAIEAIVEGASGYCNLEYDLAAGRRGRRVTHVVAKLASVTGAEAATVVNNNAAATLLILQTFAAGRSVVVSRGHLIEIGGSYRLPDIMRASGACLHEVGTTNRTRIADYEKAIDEQTALLLHVHTSNYRIVGFTEETSIGELAELAHRRGLIAVDDLGSGALFDLRACGLPDEPGVGDSLAAGADIVCFSGDKLLGGPQCGVILGKRDLIKKIEANPLARACRVGKLTLLALEATLTHYVDQDDALASIPTLAMLATPTDELATRARDLSDQLKAALPKEDFLVCSGVGYAGGGSMPQRELETIVVQWRPSCASVDDIATALRDTDVPVIAHIRDDALCFDLRTIPPSDFEALVASVTAVVWERMPEETGDDPPEAP